MTLNPRARAQIKICGLTRAGDIAAVNRLGIEMAGFNFCEKSPRCLRADTAAALAAQCDPAVHRVALLVDPDDEAIDTALAAVSPTYLQLHGEETVARVADIRRRSHCGLIKALPIAEKQDFDSCADYAPLIDLFLFDAKPPPNGQPGGNGVAFDWSLLKHYAGERPYLLAGGLTAENVARALVATQAPMVDISSGVETAPGVKDAALIEDFVKAVQAA